MQPHQAMAAGSEALLAPAGSEPPGSMSSAPVEPPPPLPSSSSSPSALRCPEVSMACCDGAAGPTKSAEQTDSDARPRPVVSGSTPPPPPPPPPPHTIHRILSTGAAWSASSCRYRECLKNHAANLGAHATDGCGEFMAGGEEGSVEALFCAACRCHRNFHRRETVIESSHPPPPPLLLPPPPPPLHHHHHHHHQQQQYVPSSNIYCEQLYPHHTTNMLNPRFTGTLGSNNGSKRSVNNYLSDRQLSSPPLADGMPRRHGTGIGGGGGNTLPAPPPTMMMAFNNSHHIHELLHHHHHQEKQEDDNDDDDGDGDGDDDDVSNMNLEFGYTKHKHKHKQCGIQYNHHFMSMTPSYLMNPSATNTTTTTTTTTGLNPNHKRFRTKFTCEQKEKMCHFAEKIGWRFHKDDDDAVRKFCAEVGVKRHVLKVWMHNNKHNFLGSKVKTQ